MAAASSGRRTTFRVKPGSTCRRWANSLTASVVASVCAWVALAISLTATTLPYWETLMARVVGEALLAVVGVKTAPPDPQGYR